MKSVSDMKMFEPFIQENSFSHVLYVSNDGKHTTERPEGEDFKIWRISKCDNDDWLITLHEDYFVSDVYIGKISTREFFVELMKNVVEGFEVEKI